MGKFTLKALWDLRAELDEAITTENYEDIKIIKQKYIKLVEEELNSSLAFTVFNIKFHSSDEMQVHNYQNVNSILKNIENYEKKYIDGEQVSLKLKKQCIDSFLAEEIWILRAMYDKFLLNGSNKSNEMQTQQNMILGRAIIDKLKSLAFMSQNEEYFEQILGISYEVRDKYEVIYGRNKPKLDYYHLSDEYVER